MHFLTLCEVIFCDFELHRPVSGVIGQLQAYHKSYKWGYRTLSMPKKGHYFGCAKSMYTMFNELDQWCALGRLYVLIGASFWCNLSHFWPILGSGCHISTDFLEAFGDNWTRG